MKRILFLIAVFAISNLFGATIKQTTIGYTYVALNKASYQAVEIGTSIVVITKKGIVRPYTGVEVSAPIFFDSKGTNLQNAENKGTGFGVALQVPLIFGLDISGFYIQAMGGYNISWLNDSLKNVPSGAQIGALKTAKTKTISQGFIYGGGLGYSFTSNFTLGVRFLKGSMNNEIIDDPTSGAIDKKYKTNYTKIMALIGYNF